MKLQRRRLAWRSHASVIAAHLATLFRGVVPQLITPDVRKNHIWLYRYVSLVAEGSHVSISMTRASWKQACLSIDWFVGFRSGELLKLEKKEREGEREGNLRATCAPTKSHDASCSDDSGCCTRPAINSVVSWQDARDVINDNRSNINLAHVSRRGEKLRRAYVWSRDLVGDSVPTACWLASRRRR